MAFKTMMPSLHLSDQFFNNAVCLVMLLMAWGWGLVVFFHQKYSTVQYNIVVLLKHSYTMSAYKEILYFNFWLPNNKQNLKIKSWILSNSQNHFHQHKQITRLKRIMAYQMNSTRRATYLDTTKKMILTIEFETLFFLCQYFILFHT